MLPNAEILGGGAELVSEPAAHPPLQSQASLAPCAPPITVPSGNCVSCQAVGSRVAGAPGTAPCTSQVLGDWSGGRITLGLAGRDRAAGLRQWKPRRTPSKGLQDATFPKTTPAPVWWLVLDKNDAEAAADKGRESDSKEPRREGVSLPQEGT